MKKKMLFPFMVLSLILLLAGCGRAGAHPVQEASPAPTAEPTPSPTPVPTPAPFESVLADAAPRFSYLTDEASVLSALETARSNAAGGDLRFDMPDLTVCSAASCGAEETIADMIVRDGDKLYILSDKDLMIVSLEGEGTHILSRTTVGRQWKTEPGQGSGSVYGSEKAPIALYPAGEALAVVYDCYGFASIGGELTYNEYTEVEVFDLTGETPAVLTSFGQDGLFSAAGLRDGVFYLVTGCSDASEEGKVRFPNVYNRGLPVEIPADRILFAEEGSASGFSVLGSYEMDTGKRTDVWAVLGFERDVYAADGTILFYSRRYAQGPSRSFEGFSEALQVLVTDLCRFRVTEEGLRADGSAALIGGLPDSRCMHLSNGQLRCLTVIDSHRYAVDGAEGPFAQDEDRRGALLSLLNEDMEPLGSLGTLPKDEAISWAGFLPGGVILTGEEGHSFRADLSDPAWPDAGTRLKQEIRADALHPWGEDGLIAFTQTEPGRLSLTVYDADLKAMAGRDFGSDFSSTLENVRGYFTDYEKGLIGFTADDSYCFYTVTEDALSFVNSVYLEDWAWNARAFADEDALYVADTGEVLVYSTDGTEQTAVLFW